MIQFKLQHSTSAGKGVFVSPQSPAANVASFAAAPKPVVAGLAGKPPPAVGVVGKPAVAAGWRPPMVAGQYTSGSKINDVF